MASTGRSSEEGVAGASGRAPSRSSQASATSGGAPPSSGISRVATGSKPSAQPTRSCPRTARLGERRARRRRTCAPGVGRGTPEFRPSRTLDEDRSSSLPRKASAGLGPTARVRRRASRGRERCRTLTVVTFAGTVPLSPRSGAALFLAGRVPRHGTGARGAEGPMASSPTFAEQRMFSSGT